MYAEMKIVNKNRADNSIFFLFVLTQFILSAVNILFKK
ncbi:hypothetical protein DCCM_3921 [Desulfocucumis palustris]|uniref:Uncharacterized protein n=1 Tax=Desulfocucumis palustris TaxID=1898651 RepID=A0A2L2XLH0_9FIRM|nr:hypothetical protein DCCM_3921 [Desulfocucumis palustris]